MRKRTHSREIALQILYQVEMNPASLREVLDSYWQHNTEVPDEEVRRFAEKLFIGTKENTAALDEIIAKAADNWVMDRMAVLDRNILRLGAYELLHCDDIPPKVAINEAVNLAKKFSQEESGKFVNGVLDKINHSSKTPASGPADAKKPRKHS